MIPEAAVEAAARVFELVAYGDNTNPDEIDLHAARQILEAAAPHMLADYLLALAADVKIRGDIGKDGGVEAWDYLTRRAELIRPAP